MSSTFYLKPGGGGSRTTTENIPDDDTTSTALPINFIAQITGRHYNNNWEELTTYEKNKIFSQVFGNNSKQVLYSTLVQLEYIAKGIQFATSTTCIELDEWDDDWKLYESRILCLTSLNTNTTNNANNAKQIYSLEFISEETGSICNLEVEEDLKFSISAGNQFSIYDKKLKDKFKKLTFSTKTKDNLLEFVDILNRTIVTMNETKPKKLPLTPLNLPNPTTSVPTTTSSSSPKPNHHFQQVPSSPSPSSSNLGNGSSQPPPPHEPLTAKRIIEIIRKMFERKEEKKKKIVKTDISGPSDFRHIQHVGMDLDTNIMKDSTTLLELPSGINPINGAAASSSNPNSPIQDKHTMSFIYDVIEECREPASKKSLRAETMNARQTIQFPVLPNDLTDSEMSSLLNLNASVSEVNKSQVGFNNSSSTERARLIRDLKIHLQDEDTRKLIFDFIEAYKQEVKAIKTETTAVQTDIHTSPLHHASANNNRWTSGRLSAPPLPPPKQRNNPSIHLTNQKSSEDSDENKLNNDPPSSVDTPDYSNLKNSLRAELRHNFASPPTNSSVPQPFSYTGSLGRSNTWSNNKGNRNTFCTLPHSSSTSKPPINKQTQIKKTHSDRRRPTSPPPPPVLHLRKSSNEESVMPNNYSQPTTKTNSTDSVGFKIDKNEQQDDVEPSVNQLTNKFEENAKKSIITPPVPKPRKLVRRINSNPSMSENEVTKPAGPTFQSSKSFDTETGTGVTPQIQLVAELKEKMDSINNK